MEAMTIKNAIEVILMTAGKPLTVKKIKSIFPEDDRPDDRAIQSAIASLIQDYENRGIELVEVANGLRIQTRQAFSFISGKLLEERPTKYSRAILETIALIAYRQPITRADIEDIRGVSVSTSMVKTLMERDWVRIVGHKDVPGRPALYATTKTFLDYFNLSSLEELPSLAELKELSSSQLKQAGLEVEEQDINDVVTQAAKILAESVDFIVATTPGLTPVETHNLSEQVFDEPVTDPGVAIAIEHAIKGDSQAEESAVAKALENDGLE